MDGKERKHITYQPKIILSISHQSKGLHNAARLPRASRLLKRRFRKCRVSIDSSCARMITVQGLDNNIEHIFANNVNRSITLRPTDSSVDQSQLFHKHQSITSIVKCQSVNTHQATKETKPKPPNQSLSKTKRQTKELPNAQTLKQD
eukprot:Selendium_serpulae@DN6059_c0_g2_i1.p1